MKDLLLNQLISMGLPKDYCTQCLDELFRANQIKDDASDLESLREAVAGLLQDVVVQTLPSSDRTNLG